MQTGTLLPPHSLRRVDPFDSPFGNQSIFLDADRNLVATPFGCRSENDEFKRNQAVGSDFIGRAQRKNFKQGTAHIMPQVASRVHTDVDLDTFDFTGMFLLGIDISGFCHQSFQVIQLLPTGFS